MAATFNASPLPQGLSQVQGLSKPAAAAAGGAAPAGGADSTSSLAGFAKLNSAPTFTGSVTAPGFVGNSSTATKLLTARLINGTPFDGTADITLSGGGGGGGGPVNPDSAQNPQDPADDEFEFGASVDTTGARRAGATPWSWDNQGASSAVIDRGALRIVPQLVTGTTHRGIQQAAPVGTWKYRAKLRTVLAVASQAAIYVTRGTRYIKFGFNVTFSGNVFQVFVQRLTNATTVDSTPYLPTAIAAPDAWTATTGSNSPPGYFEIEYDGASLFFRWSATGYDGDFRVAHTELAATFLLGAPTGIGLSAQPNSATVQQQMIVDWFRRMTAPGISALDVANTNAGLTLSNSNRTVARNAAGASLVTSFSEQAYAAGKRYFEVRIDSMNPVTNFQIHGVALSGTANNNNVAFTSGGYGYYAATGQRFNNNFPTAYGASYAQGDIVQVALDMDAGRVFFGKNGVWQGSGDPVAGTNPAYAGLSGSFKAGVSLYNGSNPPNDVATIRLRAADFTYSPPSGYSAWV